MTRFFGKIGYGSSVSVEGSPGVYDYLVTERSYYGDLTRISVDTDRGEKVNGDISLGNVVSLIVDTYANEHLDEIKYVTWRGTRWEVKTVEVSGPRLLLRLGGVYNGPT